MASIVRRAAGVLQSQGRRSVIPGQPTPATHPELLAPGELQPEITAGEFEARRRQLLALLPDGAVAVVPAAPIVPMAGVIPYPYRPDADFLYLTGIQQPMSLAVLDAGGGYTLFVPDQDSWREQWDGVRLNPDAATELYGAHQAFPMAEMPVRLSSILSQASSVVYDLERAGETSGVRHLAAFQELVKQDRVQHLRPLMHRLRWRKSSAELSLMRRSASIAAASLASCMRASHDMVHEHSLAAQFEYGCKAAGAQRMAYPPVVAGGADACTIHYSRNDKHVPGTDLLLLDGGCEFHGYCSDVTRTWPVGGRYSDAQRAVYDVVLDCHRRCLEVVQPGATLRQLHQLSVRLLCQGLRDLQVVASKSVDALAQTGSYRLFYPHSVGHWLGMDTHDTSSISHDRPLEPGVVLTIEPGLYIPDDEAYGSLRGVGVRIEDDVAVTGKDAGHEVLSREVPVDPKQVEALVGSCSH
ncbi:hypothetical protein N2152v2_010381 [Parachlorella kessleri]